MISAGNTYTFIQLQEWLGQWENRGICLALNDMKTDFKCIMHVFDENFSGEYQSGDAILFYSDGEVTSAEDDTRFFVLKIINISEQYFSNQTN